MDSATRQTALWLDMRFRLGRREGRYYAHSPIYGLEGLGGTEAEVSIARRYALGLRLQRILGTLQPRSLLDVGCAEGHLLAVAKDLWRVPAVAGCDLSAEACLMARAAVGVPAFPACAHALPFADDSWDIVVMSEVLEHLEFPLQALAECWRVARRAVVVSTQEFHFSEIRRRLAMATTNRAAPHSERQWSSPSDWHLVFGRDRVAIEPQGSLIVSLSSPVDPRDPESTGRIVRRVADHPDRWRRSFGAVGVAAKDPGVLSLLRRGPERPDREICAGLFTPRADRGFVPASGQPLAEEVHFESPRFGTPLLAGSAGEDDGLGAPDWRIRLAEQEATEVLRCHHGSTRTLLRRDRWLRKPRLWGGWRTFLGEAIEDLLWKTAIPIRRKVRIREGLGSIHETLGCLPGPIQARGRQPKLFDIRPRATKPGGTLVWRIDASNVPGIGRAAIECSFPDAPLPPPGLLDGAKSRASIQEVVRGETPWPSADYFPLPGTYQLRLLAIGGRGSILGSPSPVVEVTVLPDDRTPP